MIMQDYANKDWLRKPLTKVTDCEFRIEIQEGVGVVLHPAPVTQLHPNLILRSKESK